MCTGISKCNNVSVHVMVCKAEEKYTMNESDGVRVRWCAREKEVFTQ